MKLQDIDANFLDSVTGGNSAQTIARHNLEHRWGLSQGVVTFDRNRQRFTVDPLWGGEAQKRSFSVTTTGGHVHARSKPL
jgi:hypothetical protein